MKNPVGVWRGFVPEVMAEKMKIERKRVRNPATFCSKFVVYLLTFRRNGVSFIAPYPRSGTRMIG